MNSSVNPAGPSRWLPRCAPRRNVIPSRSLYSATAMFPQSGSCRFSELLHRDNQAPADSEACRPLHSEMMPPPGFRLDVVPVGPGCCWLLPGMRCRMSAASGPKAKSSSSTTARAASPVAISHHSLTWLRKQAISGGVTRFLAKRGVSCAVASSISAGERSRQSQAANVEKIDLPHPEVFYSAPFGHEHGRGLSHTRATLGRLAPTAELMSITLSSHS